MEKVSQLLETAYDLEDAGLIWQPEIGDEISDRAEQQLVSILVDNNSMTPVELREMFLWLPTLEQMIQQIEARQGVLLHAGLELSQSSLCYKAVLQIKGGAIESEAFSLRNAVGKALRDLIHFTSSVAVH